MANTASVLIVDDDRDFLKIVQRILELNGYSVSLALDAMDALDKIQRETFDLVLSDANMPYRSGFDLIKTIRSSTRTPNVAIALLTGRRDKKDVQHGLECGADDYIVKPVDPDLFLAKIDSLLQRRSLAARSEVNFAESPVHMEAQWETKTEVTRVSEQGITLTSSIAIAPNSKMKVASTLFELIGIEPPHLRVLSCTPVQGNPYQFLTRVSFVGLTDGDLQKIRFWVNTNIGLQKGTRAS